jgi:hypothetical protein
MFSLPKFNEDEKKVWLYFATEIFYYCLCPFLVYFGRWTVPEVVDQVWQFGGVLLEGWVRKLQVGERVKVERRRRSGRLATFEIHSKSSVRLFITSAKKWLSDNLYNFYHDNSFKGNFVKIQFVKLQKHSL